MPIDYSKWDAIELSDDEDFECHPNVDKKSMVRWKQAQIHKERQERKDVYELLVHEQQLNNQFLLFLEQLKSRSVEEVAKEAEEKFTEEMKKDSLSRIQKWPGNWEPPNWGSVLTTHVPWHEEILKYKNQDPNDALTKLKTTFEARNQVIDAEIKRLDHEMKKKLTMDQLHTGFDKTFVPTGTTAPAADLSTEKDTTLKKQTAEEVIFTPKEKSIFEESIQQEILQEYEATDDQLRQKHPKLLEYSQSSDYSLLAKLLRDDKDLNKEANEEALLLRGLCLEILGKPKEAKNCVINSLIMKFVRSLGVVDLFFQRLTGTGSSAQNLFWGDVKNTYEHIQKRSLVLRKEKLEKIKKEEEAREARVKLVQKFSTPDGYRMPLGDEPTEVELKMKEWFNVSKTKEEGLLYEDVDKINEFLGSLEPQEAERQAEMAVKAGFIQLQPEEEESEES